MISKADPDERVIDLHNILKILKRRLLWIIAIPITVLLVAAIVIWRLTPIYQATAQVEVLPSTSSQSGQSALENLIDPRSALQTQVELIKSPLVLGPAGEELGIEDSSALAKLISVQLLQGTQIVEIRVEHRNPQEARNYANSIANAYVEFRRTRAQETSLAASEAITRQMEGIRTRVAEIEGTGLADTPGSPEKTERDRLLAQLGALEGQFLVLPDAEALRRGGGTVISLAEVPDDPIRPRKALNLGLAMFIGFALALAAALIAESLDDRLKDPEDVERLLGVPVLGHIPVVDKWAESESAFLAIENETSNNAAEAYRTLRTNLNFVSLDLPLKSVLITSATAGAGKTTTAANLAAVFAQSKKKTILVAGDLRKPAAHRILRLSNAQGITQALGEKVPLYGLLQRHRDTNLRLLAAGGTPPNPTEVLASAQFGEILNQIKQVSDMVIIDSPPILGLGDVSALASRVDGVVLVVNAGSVTRKELLDGVDQLRKAGGRLIGCVMNAVDAKDGYGYYYQNYYADYVKDEPESTNGVGPSSHPWIDPVSDGTEVEEAQQKDEGPTSTPA